MGTQMMEKMKWLIRSRNTCVLATASGGRPHCSLMAYVPDDACGEIYMATHRDTTKYRNVSDNPHVSLLIDTREEHPGKQAPELQALTIEGRFQPIRDPQKRLWAGSRLTAAHPYMGDFLKDPDAEIFSVRVVSFLLLKGISEAYYEEAQGARR